MSGECDDCGHHCLECICEDLRAGLFARTPHKERAPAWPTDWLERHDRQIKELKRLIDRLTYAEDELNIRLKQLERVAKTDKLSP